MSSLSEYIANQDALEQEARGCMPYDPKECTFMHGPLRQELYACQTCYKLTGQLNAICYACSIKCHTSHDLIELFTKRERTCDCGTNRFKFPCFVRYPNWSNLLLDLNFKKKFDPDIPDLNNKYGHNFKGLFCSCNKPYNPLIDSNMIQCIFGIYCDEDWYHEECLMGLKPGIINRNPNIIIKKKNLNLGQNRLNELSEPGLDANDDDDDDDDSYDILPLNGFPDLNSFETIICWKCVSKFPYEMNELKLLLNCESIDYIPANSIDERINILHKNKNNNNNNNNNENDNNNSSIKRKKKEFPKTLFLKDNYKSILKSHINSNPDTLLSKFLNKYKFMYEDDPIFKYPDDNDDSSSIFELGIKELKNIPTDQAVQGLAAYEKIKSKLTEFLKPFAQEGRIVTEEEVKAFFNSDMKEK
jgi:E3 ubiquitin-protein ligase UBR7